MEIQMVGIWEKVKMCNTLSPNSQSGCQASYNIAKQNALKYGCKSTGWRSWVRWLFIDAKPLFDNGMTSRRQEKVSNCVSMKFASQEWKERQFYMDNGGDWNNKRINKGIL